MTLIKSMQPFVANFMREVNSLFAVNICLDAVQLWTVLVLCTGLLISP